MAMLQNYVLGSWIQGDGNGQELYNAVNGNIIATTSTQGLDF
jgi:oxepin-CoA hydrolase/3-oxo-5,6-dehydrosuberyl-CoA semialdehyde dehydrogenase